ncbi:cation-translocating P-type ATPase [Pygmaiobacter massiliensis]|uniref:cation-translocating P-type ATPase n=1 Tax=Pygmaiobacter massiliensis TaxID=1917873 RepID=UPI002A814AA2|nr:cation-translocating P-type ATPase [Pygmaiobacter massiliensis]MDY4784411.1 cation-translocating P-type ATPase [Pygmaiobacter massiliensis]
MFEQKHSEDVFLELGSNPSGLSAAEAADRLARDGENALKEKDPPTRLQTFLAQLKDPMIYILLGAAAISVFLKEYSDAVIILCVVLLNAVVGMVQEGKAQRALEALKQMSSPTATVRRNGIVSEIPAAQLVKGDVVLLDAGRVVPADLRLTTTASLKVDESALTGESVPVEKDAKFLAEGEIPLGDRINMAYSSTSVTYGRGEGVVIATAADTEIGRIAAMLESSTDELTPLQKSLAVLGKMLGIIAIVLCVALFGIAILQKRDIIEMLLTAISLAVAAVPEGLPAVVTIVLAIGVQRMVKVNSIVRRLPAVETLGAVSVVCSDKTGTLTQNKMTVIQVMSNGNVKPVAELNAESDRLFLDGFVLCNDASTANGSRIGDPTELALLDMGAPLSLTREGIEETAPRINEQAFDSDRKLMTTVHRRGEEIAAYTKGAVDQLLPHCVSICENGVTRAITEEDKKRILGAASDMSKQALRVLALAVKYGDSTATEEELTFVGLVGMIDPARPEAKASVANFRKAGITTIMITGDHRDTAFAIAKELGIAEQESQCITGEELDSMTQEQLNARVLDLRVFARVSPTHKVRIVQAFKSHNKVVSMTGDGVNDAPSLKAADIGVAMGITGTDVAKGAADMVLTDDNFSTIEKAIEEGRGIYANIKKTVIFLLGSNLGEVTAMFGAIVVGLASPLKAVHILWVNLITDSLPALALGADEKPRGIMERQPRSEKDGLFSGGGLFLTIFYGILIALMTVSAFLYIPVSQLLASGTPINVASLDALLVGDLLTKAQTFAFTTLAVSQLWHSLGMRDVDTSIFITLRHQNKLMFLSFGVGLLLQVCATEIPLFAGVFGTATLAFSEWLSLIVFAMLPLLFHEIFVPIRKALGVSHHA